jgi:hypothetical protein
VNTVGAYQEQFLSLLCHADSLTSQQQINLFTSGLMEPIKTDVELQHPVSLQLAMSLARAFEKRHLLTSPPLQPTKVQPRPVSQQRSIVSTATQTTVPTVVTPILALPRVGSIRRLGKPWSYSPCPSTPHRCRDGRSPSPRALL